VDILAGIFAAALLQDLAYTSKTALVSRGHRRLAVAADVSAMLTSSLYLILAASVTMRAGLSIATVEAFAAIAIGGAFGTMGGMYAVDWLEGRFALSRPILEGHSVQQQRLMRLRIGLFQSFSEDGRQGFRATSEHDLVAVGGRERTRVELEELFAGGGWRLDEREVSRPIFNPPHPTCLTS
jgi:hypothetical protein